MRIVITGAAGLVGRALRERSGARGDEVHALTHADLDITDRDAVLRVVDRLKPHVLFNCAVIGVDECEIDPSAARRINVDGPANLADACRLSGAVIAHFSTNYVFPGDEEKFYTIDDEPRAVNVYGATKIEGENAVRDRCERSFVVRTSWVFGRGKQSFLATAGERLRRGERITAIRDIFCSTTCVEDLAPRVLEIVDRSVPGVYHVVNAGICSYETFARESARIVNADETLIETVSEKELMRSPRPRYTPMRCLMSERLGFPPLREWREALQEYLTK